MPQMVREPTHYGFQMREETGPEIHERLREASRNPHTEMSAMEVPPATNVTPHSKEGLLQRAGLASGVKIG